MYWGKIIGTLAGLATTKPLLALVGLFLGHQFDRGFAGKFRSFERQGRLSGRVSEDYLRALFSTMGHVAKADGRVSEDEIRAARSLMHRLALKPAEVRKAIDWFEAGKSPAFPLEQTLAELKRGAGRKGESRTLFVRLLLEVSLSKNRLAQDERARLWMICRQLDVGRVELAQLEAMIRAQKGFRQSPAGSADSERVRNAYRTLGLDESASNDDIKKAYRRLMSRNHPDKLAASTPDATAVAAAERRTREVRSAYEMLKARRSIR